MKPYDSLPLYPKDSSDDLGEEDDSFLPESEKTILSRNRSPTIHFAILYTIIVVLFTSLVSEPKWRPKCHDPSLGLYSPAQEVVTYKQVEFGKHFANKSPYMPEQPTAETDEMWEDLYNFGISGITTEEASHLNEPTAHLPHDNSTYVVSLDVFHELHCVNHLRKALYPDQYPGLWEYNEDGTVDHTTTLSLHWDHCIDILRQTLMCHADITPQPFFYRASDDNVYSVLASTHTCRDYDKVKEWALERQLKSWVWGVTTQTSVDESMKEGLPNDK